MSLFSVAALVRECLLSYVALASWTHKKADIRYGESCRPDPIGILFTATQGLRIQQPGCQVPVATELGLKILSRLSIQPVATLTDAIANG